MNAFADIVELVKSFEGFRSKRYADAAGIATIGYGDTELARTRDTISPEEAHAALVEKLTTLADRLETSADAASRVVPVRCLYATVSLAYNIGYSAAVKSKWWRSVLDGDRNFVYLLRWCNVNGQPLFGLLRRRIAESLFAAGIEWRRYTDYDGIARAYVTHDRRSRLVILQTIADDIERLATLSP